DGGLREDAGFVERVSRENHHAQTERPSFSRQNCGARGVGQRLPAEQGDSFDPILIARGLDLRNYVGDRPNGAAVKRQHLGVAAAGAAEWAALEPQRESPARTFGVGARDDLGDGQSRTGGHAPIIAPSIVRRTSALTGPWCAIFERPDEYRRVCTPGSQPGP